MKKIENKIIKEIIAKKKKKKIFRVNSKQNPSKSTGIFSRLGMLASDPDGRTPTPTVLPTITIKPGQEGTT